MIGWGESAYAEERYICTQALFGTFSGRFSKAYLNVRSAGA